MAFQVFNAISGVYVKFCFNFIHYNIFIYQFTCFLKVGAKMDFTKPENLENIPLLILNPSTSLS